MPEGQANRIRESVPGPVLPVFSGKTPPETYADSWRCDNKIWITWSENE